MRQIVIHIPEDKSFEVVEVLQEVCGLRNVTKNTEDGIVQLTCLVDAHSSGYVMYQLDRIGCGVAYGKITLIPVSVVKPLPRGQSAVVDKANNWYRQLANAKTTPLNSLFPSTNQDADNQEMRNKFSRLAVEEIYSVVDGGCSMSADYFSYICVASMIAAVGLTTNNSVMIVASMLVSPLMGPILGFTYGTAIWDLALIRRGVVAELAGVGVTALIGFIAGFIISGWDPVPATYAWPTAEMASRGDTASLLVGIFFAVPSGVGVALSATQGGVNSLVGVAIAASLLPPVVNVGMCLAYALAGDDGVNEPKVYFDIAGLSLALFMLNIGVIYVVCLCVFRFKKITPVRRQLSRYQDLPPLKIQDPNLATSSDGINSQVASTPQVVLATPAGLGSTTPQSFGGLPAAGTLLELRPLPACASSYKAHGHQGPPGSNPTKVDAYTVGAHMPTSSALESLATQDPGPAAPPPALAPGSNSSACSDLDAEDLGRSCSARLLEHVQGQGKAVGGGRGVLLSCEASAEQPVPLPSLLRDDPLDASSGGALLGPNLPVMLGGTMPAAGDPGSTPAAAAVPAPPLAAGRVGRGAAAAEKVLEGPAGSVELGARGAVVLQPRQPRPWEHVLPQSEQQQQQQQQQQARQQRSLFANEWTLTEETLEHWAEEVIRSPGPLAAAAAAVAAATASAASGAPRGRPGSAGQLELSAAEEAQLRARWNRLVERHFGVKLEDVEEGNEEGEDEEGGNKHRPSLEQKFQGFLKKLGNKMPRSSSSRSLGSISGSTSSFRARFSKQSLTSAASHSSTGVLASSPTQQDARGSVEASPASFGSNAFAESGRTMSQFSVGSERACKELGPGMGRPGAAEKAHLQVHSGSGAEQASAQACSALGVSEQEKSASGGEGTKRHEAAEELRRGLSRLESTLPGLSVAGGGAEGQLSCLPNAPLSAAGSGRMTRTPEEAWDLLRRAVLSEARQKSSSSRSSSQRGSRQNSMTGDASGAHR